MGVWNERLKPGFKKMWNSFSTYESPKYVLVKDASLSFISISIQILVIFYIFIWNIYLDSGYQRKENFAGQATIKVKGNTKSNSGRFFDAVDLVIPPQEEGGVFITTNYVRTPHQKICNIPGVDLKGNPPADISEICTDPETNTCPENKMTANGISTGNCLWSDIRQRKMCEIMTWCPLEDDNIGRVNILPHTENFTVFIRIDGRYPTFPYDPISNVDKKMVYNVNLFYVSDISAAGEITGYPVQPAEKDPVRLPFEYFNNTIEKGQIVLIEFKFDCNLDYSLTKCKPEITFQRIDDSDFSSGFNFRYSNKYYVNDIEERDLWKIYGMKILVTVTGKGRKFDIVTLLIALGSGIGLFGVANFVCDNLLRFFIKEDKVYEVKYDKSCVNKTDSIFRKLTSSRFKIMPRPMSSGRKSSLASRESPERSKGSKADLHGSHKTEDRVEKFTDLTPIPEDSNINNNNNGNKDGNDDEENNVVQKFEERPIAIHD